MSIEENTTNTSQTEEARDAVHWQPYREPIHVTLMRTGMIAVIGGLVLAVASPGGLRRWPVGTVLFLWPALGGHFVEVFFLNWIRPRLPGRRGVQVLGRVVVWMVGGVVLLAGMLATAWVIGGDRQPRWGMWPVGWVAVFGAVGFVGVELVAHGVMRMRRVGNFYDGRG